MSNSIDGIKSCKMVYAPVIVRSLEEEEIAAAAPLEVEIEVSKVGVSAEADQKLRCASPIDVDIIEGGDSKPEVSIRDTSFNSTANVDADAAAAAVEEETPPDAADAADAAVADASVVVVDAAGQIEGESGAECLWLSLSIWPSAVERGGGDEEEGDETERRSGIEIGIFERSKHGR